MKKQLLFIVCCLIITSGFAQSFTLKSHLGVSALSNTAAPGEKIQFAPSAAKNLFGLDANSELVLKKTESDKLGFIHYHFYQLYKNVPVEKSMFIVHTKNGVFTSANGSIITEFDATVKSTAAISADKAVGLAIANVGATEYAWQSAGMEQRIKDQTKNPKASFYPRATLVYYNPQQSLMSRELKLCYKVDVYAVKPLSRADYFIDAQTGRVLGKNDKIYHSDVTGTAKTAYSGKRTIHSDKTGANTYRLRDYTRGDGVITLHGESGQRGDDYTSNSPNWTLNGKDIAALDAHYGVSETYDYYMEQFGRNSYDGEGAALYSYVNDPTYLDNAFWDGSAMNFNERSDGEPGGVTAIDVTGHELTHGVTQETCGLDYSYESGAMNESLSDIMGKSVQFTAKPDDVNWLLSNDMGWIIRDMSDPNSQGQPDTYKGDLWYTGGGDNGGVHYNSGVGNFMFYLLVTGGTGTNDIGNNYAVAGIGLSKADQIIYRSQSVYLTETSQYIDWRIACISAATDLYGSASQELRSVRNAFFAVGIGSDSTGCDAPYGLKANKVDENSAKLKWNPGVATVGANLQWKVVTDKKWTTVYNIPGNTYKLTGLTPGYSYQFRVQNKCSASTTSGYSEPYTFTTTSTGPEYCASSGESTTFEYIDRVKMLGDQEDRGYTSGDNSGYASFISMKFPLYARGTPDTILLRPGFSSFSYTESWNVYIDYNADGDFEDAKEFIGSGSSTGIVKIPVRVPSSAVGGKTRLRVQMSYYESELTGPCASFTYGETEDYSVLIKGASLTPPTEQVATSIAIVPNPVKNNSATASLTLAKQGNVNIKITDLSGSVLLNQLAANAKTGSNIITLNNLGRLNNGVFMVIAEQNGVVVGRAQLLISK